VRRVLAAAAVLAASLVVVPTSAASFPIITYTINGIVGTNGWYRGSTLGNFVVLHWSVSPDTIETNCLPAITVPGPEPGKTFSCYAKNAANERTDVTTSLIKVDADPPTGVQLQVTRAPDHNGWYNHPLPVTFSGSDATSGIAACPPLTYSGPEGAGVPVTGGCTDKAGNATPTRVVINYDATAPTLSKLSVGSSADANVVRWTSSEPTAKIVLQRAPRASKRDIVLYRGVGSKFVDKKIEPGIEYVYTLRGIDQAGNAAEVTLAGLPKVLTLRRVPYVPRAAPKPILRWERVAGARYYNVQLFRGAKRVLAAWPATHQLGVPAAWKWDSRSYRLRPGHYRWYVWAGVGPRSFAQYRTVGSAEFIVAPRSKR
jgi:hypothetical protein